MNETVNSFFVPLQDGSKTLDPSVIEQAIAWRVQLLSGIADGSVQASCDAWRAADPDHERAWQRIATLGRDMGATGLSPVVTRGVLREAAGSSRRTVLKSLVGIGVVGGGVLLTGEASFGLGADFQTATGEQRWLTLADGTRVLLNTASAVDVYYDTSMRQIRLLKGEIMIVTAPDRAGRPFAVVTDKGSIRPIGTRFTVRQNGDVSIGVAVFEGAVDIRPLHGASLRLKAGEHAHFSDTGVETPQLLDSAQGAWSEGMLVVERMRLADFAVELDRYRPGYLRCDPAVADIQVSGSFPVRTPDAVIELLAETLPIRVRYISRYWATLLPRA